THGPSPAASSAADLPHRSDGGGAGGLPRHRPVAPAAGAARPLPPAPAPPPAGGADGASRERPRTRRRTSGRPPTRRRRPRGRSAAGRNPGRLPRATWGDLAWVGCHLAPLKIQSLMVFFSISVSGFASPSGGISPSSMFVHRRLFFRSPGITISSPLRF